MNKEILEITKKFHDTYEKLASEYTYETREDTKVFDINSNNGKLMYATVNEIVSPILEENQEWINLLAMFKNQQKEFIKWLEDYLKLFDNMCIDEQGYYDMLEEILQKYRSIIGVEKVDDK